MFSQQFCVKIKLLFTKSKKKKKKNPFDFPELSKLTGQVSFYTQWNLFFAAALKVKITKPAEPKKHLQLREAMDGILGRWLRRFRGEPLPLVEPRPLVESAGGPRCSTDAPLWVFWLRWLFSQRLMMDHEGATVTQKPFLLFLPAQSCLTVVLLFFFSHPSILRRRAIFSFAQTFAVAIRRDCLKQRSSTPFCHYVSAGWQSTLLFTWL